MVDKSTTVVFVVLGMMFLLPVITGEALGVTTATVTASDQRGIGLSASLVEKRLDEGKWVVEPRCSGATCTWTTAGTGVFGGPEAGHVIYNYDFLGRHLAKAVFRWYNPRSGTNTCGAVLLEKVGPGNVNAYCHHIDQGDVAKAQYYVAYFH